jgi:hypothetical protein
MKNNVIQKIPEETFNFLKAMGSKKQIPLWKLIESYLIGNPLYLRDLEIYAELKKKEIELYNLNEVIKEDIEERDELLQDIQKGDSKEGDLNEAKQEDNL